MDSRPEATVQLKGSRLISVAPPEAVATLEALGQDERLLLEGLAGCFEPMSVEALAGLPLTVGGPLGPLLDELEAAGFVEKGTWGWRCDPYWTDLVLQRAGRRPAGRSLLNHIFTATKHGSGPSGVWTEEVELSLRRCRLAGALGDPQMAERDVRVAMHALARLPSMDMPVAHRGVVDLPLELGQGWARSHLDAAFHSWSLTDEERPWLSWVGGTSAELNIVVALDSAFRGRLLRPAPGDHWFDAVLAAVQSFLLEKPVDDARAAFAAARLALRRASGKANFEIWGPLGLLHVMVELAHDVDRGRSLARRVAKADPSIAWSCEMLELVTEMDDSLPECLYSLPHQPWAQWAEAHARHWRGELRGAAVVKQVRALAEAAEVCGWSWLVEGLERLATRGEGNRPPPPASGGRDLLTLCAFDPVWSRRLDALARATPRASSGEDGPAERLLWRVSVYDHVVGVSACRQKRGKRGWTKGRRITLQRLLEVVDEPWVDAADRRIIGRIVRGVDGWRGPTWSDDVATALVGHPRVVDADDPTQPLRFVWGQARVVTQRTHDGVVIRFDPMVAEAPVEVFEGPEPHTWEVFVWSGAVKALAEVVGDELFVPDEGLPRVQRVLADLSATLPVVGDVGTGVTEVEGDRTPYLRLRRRGDGVVVRAHVCPLGVAGPACALGEGADRVAATIDGERREAVRDHAAERGAFTALVEACAELRGWSDPEDAFVCPELEATLSLLAHLRMRVDEGAAVVEWEVDTAPIHVDRAEADMFRMTIATAGDWLAVSGQVAFDEELVVDLRTLLEGDRRVGGFVRIDRDHFVAIGDALRDELSRLDAFAELSRGKLRMPSSALVAWADDPAVDRWEVDRDAEARLREAKEILATDPRPPGELVGELRPYQALGLRWLAHRASLGFGACLADDMGLGKTIQLLALLLLRASHGPSLVVAPTSVCGNWVAEAQRFAPTLRIVTFADADDREAVLATAGPHDVIVTSYGLLARDGEALAATRFEVAILDEAQAIKNHRTKRARAAFALSAHARVAATGTPLQNRLGELHSIFRFLQPGLLGSMRSFNEQFAKPIERDGDARAMARLRERVAPFLLRRTKAAVLDELPPRTDVTLRVEPLPAEAALYEALREEALAALKAQREKAAAERESFQILAALTTLRRACCHPSLVAPDGASPPEGNKLRTATELVRELVDAGHRCLVFSQFVDVLTLAREAFEAGGLALQYLDGSTPARQRARRVDAFQAGEGDAFLISTHAGGFGLNLTGADYVIHLDPWWNPAVEDQASDRAHRIGQQRPVTVYRLVMAGSIEEQIVALHDRKRDLADTLLADSDAPRTLDLDELIALLQH